MEEIILTSVTSHKAAGRGSKLIFGGRLSSPLCSVNLPKLQGCNDGLHHL